MKVLLLLTVLVSLSYGNNVRGFGSSSGSIRHAEGSDDLYCGIKPCFMDLFSFVDLSFSNLVKKIHHGIFCIRECSPPQVQELFQSISYFITKRIPGYCSGDSCIDNNRFVGLSHCMKNRSWPLVQCASKLVSLAQLMLEPVEPELVRNKSCSIVIQAINCVEKTIEECGPKPYSLVQEIFETPFQMIMNFFCRVHYRKDGHVIELTLPSTQSTASVPTRIPSLFPPVAKGFVSRREDGGDTASTSRLSVFALVATACAILTTLWYR